MLKNKQPINLSFLVCLSIQSSYELTPWLSQTSRLHTIHCFTAHTAQLLLSTTACNLSPEKLQGLGAPIVSTKDAQAKPRVQRTGNSASLFGHKQHNHVTSSSNENCVVVWLGEETKSSVCLFLSQVDSHRPGKGRASFNCFPVLVTWWQEGLLHGWALGAIPWKHSWAFCLSKNYQVKSLSSQGGKERKDKWLFQSQILSLELL